MKWLVLSWAILAAWVPECKDGIRMPDARYATMIAPSDTYTLDLSIDATLLKHIRLYGSTEAYMQPSGAMSFAPFRQDYSVGASVLFGPFELGVNHECDHSVYAEGTDHWYIKNETQVYLKFETKLEL
jgi:hypothetical protein